MIQPIRTAYPVVLIFALCPGVLSCAPSAPDYSGSELFAGNCSSCHGIYGDGEGAAGGSIAQSIPDLRQLAVDNGGTFPHKLVRKIIDGREIIEAHRSDVMPKWGSEFLLTEGYSEAANARVNNKIDALVDYVASIQAK